jgi:hypothetical protein
MPKEQANQDVHTIMDAVYTVNQSVEPQSSHSWINDPEQYLFKIYLKFAQPNGKVLIDILAEILNGKSPTADHLREIGITEDAINLARERISEFTK